MQQDKNLTRQRAEIVGKKMAVMITETWRSYAR